MGFCAYAMTLYYGYFMNKQFRIWSEPFVEGAVSDETLGGRKENTDILF